MRTLITTLACLCLALAGCVQIDTTVKLEEDGSATVTERLRISKYLMDLDAGQPAGADSFTALLSREDALRRMKDMGKGVTLTSHEVRAAEGDSRESLAVYKVADLNDLIYMSPLLACHDYPGVNRIAFKVEPVLKTHRYGQSAAGQVRVSVLGLTLADKMVDAPPGPPAKKKGEASEDPTPADLQIYRDIAPVFRDIMADFLVRVRFETYCPIDRTTFGVRDRMANVKYVDLINVSSEDLDRFGGKFVENEEIMLDVVRMDLGSDDVWETTKGFVGNSTVPVFLMLGSGHYQSDYKYVKIHFSPSRPLFARLFEGKELDFSAEDKARELRPAKFEEIGWKGEGKK